VSQVFSVDRSLGRHTVARALRAAGALVEVHDDHFAQNAPDEVWLPEVGRRDWAVLTKDERIRYRDAETNAAIAAGVALFIFTGRGMRDTVYLPFDRCPPNRVKLKSRAGPLKREIAAIFGAWPLSDEGATEIAVRSGEIQRRSRRVLRAT